MGTIEVKIKKLDNELGVYKAQMAKLKAGPGKVLPPSPHSPQNAVQQRALRTLKQKRMYEEQLNQLQQQTFNMEQAAMTTENLKNTMATVDAMRIANKEMKKQYKGIDIDKIESIHYDMEDLIDQANEIQESLGRTYGVPDEIDEEDLQAGGWGRRLLIQNSTPWGSTTSSSARTRRRATCPRARRCQTLWTRRQWRQRWGEYSI